MMIPRDFDPIEEHPSIPGRLRFDGKVWTIVGYRPAADGEPAVFAFTGSGDRRRSFPMAQARSLFMRRGGRPVGRAELDA